MPSADHRKLADQDRSRTPAESAVRPLGSAEVQFVLDRLPVPVAASRLIDGRIKAVNPAFAKLFGVPASQLLERDIGFLFSNVTERRRLAKQLAKDGGVYGVELESRREDGTSLWLAVWQQRIVCDGQECVVTALIDATETRQKQVQSESRMSQLQGLLETADHDREMIAHEIHDGVVQEMTSALMHLEVAGRGLEEEQSDLLNQLQIVTRLLRDGILEARRLMDRVRPPDLEQVGLCGALRSLIDRMSATSLITIEFQSAVEFDRLAPKWEHAIYRIVQEGLNNVRRHSRSRGARVDLRQQDGWLSIVVEDWGVGFDPRRVSETSFGLKGLQQRALLLGGRVQIDSVLKKGTRVQVQIPLGPGVVIS